MSGDIFAFYSRRDNRCPCSGINTPECSTPGSHCSILNILDKQAGLELPTAPGAHADMDMLEVGNTGLEDVAEARTHISLWAVTASPLLIGADVLTLSPAALTILANPAVLALNQDPLVAAAARHYRRSLPGSDPGGY